MVTKLMAEWAAFRTEFPRLRFDVLILLLVMGAIVWLAASQPVGPDGQNLLATNVQEVLFKLLLLSLPLIYWHVSRRTTWPYINLEACIFGTGRWEAVPPTVRGAVAFGVLVGYPIVIHGCLTW